MKKELKRMQMDEKKYLKESAQRAVQKGDVRKALKLYEELIESDPDDMQARNTLGDIYSRIGMVNEAINNFIYIAKEMSLRGFYHKCIAMMKKAVRLDKNNPGIYLVMADAYASLKLIGEARTCYNWLLDFYSGRSDKKSEIAILKKLYELTPNDPSVKKGLMKALSASGPDDEVSEEYFKIGMNSFESKNYNEAYVNFIQCLKSDSGNNEARLFAAECLIKEGKLPEAIAFIDEQELSQIHDIRCWKLLSRVYYAADKNEQALEMVRKVLESEGDNTEYKKLLGRVYVRLGRNSEADGLFRKILSDLYDSKKYDEFLKVCSELDDEELLNNEMREKRAEIFKISGKCKEAAEDNISISIYYEGEEKFRKSLIYAERALALCFDDKDIEKQVENLKQAIEDSEKPVDSVSPGEIINEANEVAPGKMVTNIEEIPAVQDKEDKSTSTNNDGKMTVIAECAFQGINETKVDSFFNLATELKEDIEGKKKNHNGINNGEPVDVQDTLIDFKRAVECTIEENDMQTHLDLGIAYMEMELYTEAIAEFKKSICDKGLFIDSLIFCAKCEFALGNQKKAIEMMGNALSGCSEDHENYLVIKYNKALFYENMNSIDNALSDYDEISDENPFYKDVRLRIRHLRQKRGSATS